MRSRDFDSPEAFYRAIPKTLPDNIKFREKLHGILATDEKLQNIYRSLISLDPKILFNSALWTYNPKNQAGYRNLPFILWPHQERAIDELHKARLKQYDVVIHKSREEGATEIIVGYMTGCWLGEPQFMSLVGSEKADKVDSGVSIDANYKFSGQSNCLFTKFSYKLCSLPVWMRPKINKTFMHLENLDNGSVINGESTNMNFGVSDRRNMILVDEIGVIEPAIAASIISNLPDVCNNNVYNSTHKLGPSHPYNQLITSGSIHVVQMLWIDNPKKRAGLYHTPDIGIVKFSDVDYWKSLNPALFDGISNGDAIRWDDWVSSFKLKYHDRAAEVEQIKLTLDGGAEYGQDRSPWLDKEVIRRGNRKQEIFQNILAVPMGAQAGFFTPETMQRIRRETIKPIAARGEVKYNTDDKGLMLKASIKIDWLSEGRLRWWGKLVDGRPDQTHQYILACDPSRGVGAANAVCGIFDATTCEQVGMWVCPDTPEERFADVVWALHSWVGGIDNDPFIIWEANNAGSFEKRLVLYGAKNVYMMHNERLAYNKKESNKRGWWSTTQSKRDLLSELDVALGCGLQTSPISKYLILRDVETLDELATYIEKGDSVIPAWALSDSSGARASHGDRVIVCGLYVLAADYVAKKKPEEPQAKPANCIGNRIQKFADEKHKSKLDQRFIYG